MTRRLLALALKEISEHALVIALVLIGLALGWLLFLLAAIGAPTTMTYLDSHAMFMRLALPTLSVALGNRLVVAEVSGRSQRFLESLPMNAREPLLVKFVLGLVLIGGVAFSSLGASALVATAREPIDLRFLSILALRTAGAAFTGWSFFFSMGLFGKLRVPLYLALLLSFALIATSTSLEVSRFGPFALVGMDMALERAVVPWPALFESVALSGFFLAAGAAVSSLREGSVEERLSKPYSQRDLAMASIAFFSVLIIWGQLTPTPEPAPYALPDEHVVYSESLPIAVSFLDDDAETDARALLARLEASVASLRSAAGWERLPQLRVVLRRSLDGSTVEPVTLARDDGALLRANFLESAAPDHDGLVAEVLAAMLDARTGRRATLEPRRWLRDGVALEWAMTHRGPGEPTGISAERAAQALLAVRVRGPDAARMSRFERVREELGARPAAALAATGIAAVRAARGEAALAALVRAAFPSNATNDLRVVVRDWLAPVRRALEERAGLSEGALFSAWTDELDRLRVRPDATALAALVIDSEAEVTFERDGLGASALVARVTTAPGRTVTLRHLSIGPFDAAVQDTLTHAESGLAGQDGRAEIRIAGRYGRGDRVLVRVDVECAALGAPHRVVSDRIEVP